MDHLGGTRARTQVGHAYATPHNVAAPSVPTISALAEIARDRLVEFEQSLRELGTRLQGHPILFQGSDREPGDKATEASERNINSDLTTATAIIRRCDAIVAELHRLIG